MMKSQLSTDVALMSYAIGIANHEVCGRHWADKVAMLKSDIQAAFSHQTRIHVLLLSAFGEMLNPIDAVLSSDVTQFTGDQSPTNVFFVDLLREIQLTDIEVVAAAPYVSLVDTKYWCVQEHSVIDSLCDQPEIKIQQLVLEHTETSQRVRVFNAHMPTPYVMPMRQEQFVKTMCDLATSTCVEQPSACGAQSLTGTSDEPYLPLPWILAGNLNTDAGMVSKWCRDSVEEGDPCISTSEWHQDMFVQRGDLAISQGIELQHVQSWVGWHNRPCASDYHDAVVVMGAIAGAEFCAIDHNRGVLQPAVYIGCPFSTLIDIMNLLNSHGKQAKGDSGNLAHNEEVDDIQQRSAAQKSLEQLHLASYNSDCTIIQADSEFAKIELAMRKRDEFVSRIADRHAACNTPTDGIPVRSKQQWIDYYDAAPLSDEDFQWVLDRWKEEYPMKPETMQKIEECRQQKTRAAKRKILELQRGSFNAYLRQEYVHKQLALALIRHPPVMVDSLLESWAEYLASPGYSVERERAGKGKFRMINPEVIFEKHRQGQRQQEADELRLLLREAKRLSRMPNTINDENRWIYKFWSTGMLKQKLDECVKHYGGAQFDCIVRRRLPSSL